MLKHIFPLGGLAYRLDIHPKFNDPGDPEYKDDITKAADLELTRKLSLFYQDFFNAAYENGIIIVQSAANEGYKEQFLGGRANWGIGDMIPGRYGTRDNELITVGGIYEDGSLWESTTPRGYTMQGYLIQDNYSPVLPPYATLGWIDVYAQSASVWTCEANNPSQNTITTAGTSIATAQVVSLTRAPRGMLL